MLGYPLFGTFDGGKMNNIYISYNGGVPLEIAAGSFSEPPGEETKEFIQLCVVVHAMQSMRMCMISRATFK